MTVPKVRLAIVMTHPIRFFVPLMQLIADRGKIELKTFYTYGPELYQLKTYNKAYRDRAEPTLPLFNGYDFEFVENISRKKSTFLYNGIQNPTLIQKVEAWQPHAILVMGWRFKSHLKLMRHFNNKIPVHFRGDSTLLDESSFSFTKKLARKILLSFVYRYVDKAWYVGTNNKAYYQKFGLREGQLVYVPHAADNDRFRRTEELKQKALLLRHQSNIDTDDIVFLCAGKLNRAKGVFLLINAFIEANIPRTHLVFAGNGPADKELRSIAAKHNNIHFMGAQTQSLMPLVYASADVLVMPSQSDTWGMVLNEAMASGMPVIASHRCGGAADLIDEGVNGHIFTSGNIAQLAVLLSDISDREKINTMGQHSLKKIEQFSYRVAAQAIEKLLISAHY